MKISYNLIHCILLSLGLTVSLAAAEFKREPYIQLTTEKSATVVWRNAMKDGASIKIGTSMDKLDMSLNAGKILTRKVGMRDKSGQPLWTGESVRMASPNEVQYEATFSGLKAETIYYYAIYDGDKRLTDADASYHFQTHPARGDKGDTRFWIVGDSGTGGKKQRQVHEGMLKYLAKETEAVKLNGYLHVGDMAYGSGTDREFTSNFFKIYEPTLRNTVCWASMGNHEGYTSSGKTQKGPYYDAYVLPRNAEAGGLASGTEAYYSFDYGNIHFICLNSHDLDRRASAPMAQWLKADLEKTKADWLVAYWHHPAYTKGSHDSDKEHQLIEMREHIMPILESGGVDVIYTGHSHIYERTMLIDGAYQTPSTNKGVVLDDGDGDPFGDGSYRKSAGLKPNNGTVHIVAGNGGTGLRKSGDHVLMSKIIMRHGSVLMETRGDKMWINMIDEKGKSLDLCCIEKGGDVARKVVMNPRKPKFIDKVGSTRLKARALPKNHSPVIPPQAEWAYLAGKDLHPDKSWISLGFDDSSWKRGKAGFGYSDKDDNTVLDMRKKFTAVYIRKNFEMKYLADVEKMGIAIRYDDGFIAYINGVEVLRREIDFGRGPTVKGVRLHEAHTVEYYSLAKYKKLFNKGKNVIAIEGHNHSIMSSDFSLDPFLTIEK